MKEKKKKYALESYLLVINPEASLWNSTAPPIRSSWESVLTPTKSFISTSKSVRFVSGFAEDIIADGELAIGREFADEEIADDAEVIINEEGWLFDVGNCDDFFVWVSLSRISDEDRKSATESLDAVETVKVAEP